MPNGVIISVRHWADCDPAYSEAIEIYKSDNTDQRPQTDDGLTALLIKETISTDVEL